jgi:hypothetical protein
MNKLKSKGARLEAADDITTAQQAFVQAVQNKVNSAFSSLLDGTFAMVNYPAGFNWAIQYGPNNYYNQSSLAEVDLQVITASNGILTLGADPFSSVYDEVLHTISYVISDADQQKINTAAQNSASQISSVINSWEANFTAISSAEQQGAVPPTKLGYIFQQVAKNWGTDPRNIPNSLVDFRTAFQAYQVAAGSAYPIQSAQALATTALQAAMANTENPSAANGGLQTGLSSFYVGYTGFPAQNMINSGLQAASNQVTISIALSDFSASSSQLSVEGGAGIGVSIGDIFGIRINGSASYDLSKYASSSTAMDMSVTYPGITFIASAPLPLNIGGTQGWYSNLILEEAVNNMGKGTAVTGYQIQGSEFSPSDFRPGGKLSRLKTFVISQLPTITLTFQDANSAAIAQDFQEQASVDVSLLGIFDIGSGSQSYQVHNVNTSSSDGSVSVTLAPPTVIGTTPAQQATAFVLGGVPSYPPNAV